MKIIAIAMADGGGIVRSVMLAPGKYVDVMCRPNGLVYVMQEENGTQVYGDDKSPVNYDLDEAEVVAFVKEVIQKA